MRSSKASSLLKQVFAAIVTVVRNKTMAVKSKATAMKTRLVIFWLIRNRGLIMSSISSKLHALTSREKHSSSGAIVSVAPTTREELVVPEYDISEDVQQDESECINGPENYYNNNPQEDDRLEGENVAIEGELWNEIDHMADEFIKRFHRQMRMEKQDSFKRYQEMLERSA